jgi:hypothetical protein
MADLVLQHQECSPGSKGYSGQGRERRCSYLIPCIHKGLQVTASVLKELYGERSLSDPDGGTIPANALFFKYLGLT